jgi:methionyl aminopeptidase
MIYLKTPEEIALLRKSNVLVGKTLAEVAKAIKVGITTLELDKIAEDFIKIYNEINYLKYTSS